MNSLTELLATTLVLSAFYSCASTPPKKCEPLESSFNYACKFSGFKLNDKQLFECQFSGKEELKNEISSVAHSFSP